MTSETRCKPCALVDETTAAVKWCVDCEDPLCDKCVQIQKGMKVTMKHQIIDIEAASIVFSSTIASLKECSKHPTSLIDFFCSKHEALCCRRCITEEHRLCDTVVPLEDACQEVKKSTLLYDTSSYLKYLLSALQDFIQNRKHTKENTNAQKKKIQANIKEFKQSMVMQLDEIEQSSLKELDELCSAAINDTEQEETKGETGARLIGTYLQQTEFMAENGSNQLLFTFLYYIQPLLKNEHDNLGDVITKASDVNVMFQHNENPLQGMRKMGSIEIRKTLSDIKIVRSKDTEAQDISLANVIPNKSFTYDRDFDGPFQWVTAIDIDKDNNILIADKCYVKLFSLQGKFIKRCKLDGDSWDLSCHRTSSRIVVTVQENGIQIIDDFIPQPKMPVPGVECCKGISFVKDTVAVGGQGKISQLDFNGKHIKTISSQTTRVIYYLYHHQRKLYFTDFKTSVHCVKDDVTKLSTLTMPEIMGAESVTKDHRGNLLVAGRMSNNVVCLSQDKHGKKKCEEVLKTEDGIIRPYAVCFNRAYKTLFVSTVDGKKVKAFICQY